MDFAINYISLTSFTLCYIKGRKIPCLIKNMLFLLHISTRGPYFYIYNSAELWFLTLKFSKDSCDIRREKKQKKQPTTPTFILLSHSIIFLPCLWVSSRSNLNWFPMHRRAIIRQQETASLFPPLGFFWGKKKKGMPLHLRIIQVIFYIWYIWLLPLCSNKQLIVQEKSTATELQNLETSSSQTIL